VATRSPPLSPDAVVGSVVESDSLSDHFMRVILESPDMARLSLPRGSDAAVGVYFGANQSAPSRTYTVRHDDRRNGRVVVDILMHGDGVGTSWAKQVTTGDKVVLAHANSWYRPPAATDCQLLVADMAGLPALARILDAPPPVATTVVVELVDETDLAYLPHQSDLQVLPLFGTGNGVSDSALVAHAMSITPAEGIGYCWFAGEASDARALRKHLRHEKRWSSDQLDVMGYWRRNSAGWDKQFALAGSDLYSVYTKALDEGKSEKVAMEEFDEALERAGL
jgi:NADPH-dependent ferric siderophore reductase